VSTWKLGANWQVFDDLRLRATLSRDIAAPTLYQLYAASDATSIPGPHIRDAMAIYCEHQHQHGRGKTGGNRY